MFWIRPTPPADTERLIKYSHIAYLGYSRLSMIVDPKKKDYQWSTLCTLREVIRLIQRSFPIPPDASREAALMGYIYIYAFMNIIFFSIQAMHSILSFNSFQSKLYLALIESPQTTTKNFYYVGDGSGHTVMAANENCHHQLLKHSLHNYITCWNVVKCFLFPSLSRNKTISNCGSYVCF